LISHGAIYFWELIVYKKENYQEICSIGAGFDILMLFYVIRVWNKFKPQKVLIQTVSFFPLFTTRAFSIENSRSLLNIFHRFYWILILLCIYSSRCCIHIIAYKYYILTYTYNRITSTPSCTAFLFFCTRWLLTPPDAVPIFINYAVCQNAKRIRRYNYIHIIILYMAAPCNNY